MYTMAEQVWASSAKIWNFHKVEFEHMCWRYRPKADKDECSIFVEEVQNLKYGGLNICEWSFNWKNKYEFKDVTYGFSSHEIYDLLS